MIDAPAAIRRIRRKRELSVADLGAISGIGAERALQLETRRGKAAGKTELRRIANALSVSSSVLGVEPLAEVDAA